MLVQFMVKNFMSFKDEAVLDMSAVNSYKEHEYHLIDYGYKEKLVKVAAIYGANASGKSNLWYAMRTFQIIVTESFNNVKENDLKVIAKYYMPFSFDDEKNNTEFQIITIINGFEYKYGFEYNNNVIASEWLYKKSLKTNRNITILERSNDNITFGASIKKSCEHYKYIIPNDTLFLTFFNRLKTKICVFKDIYTSIMQTLVADFDIYNDYNYLEKRLPHFIDSYKNSLINFLSAIDTGISDIYYEVQDKENIFFTKHYDRNNKGHDFQLSEESEGTIKSVLLYMFAKVAIENNKSIFVDELNSKLHPLLQKFIIDLFYEQSSEAQLIYTTHDTTLLDKKFFRRDQIWFVQKDEYGHSELTALSDFKIRPDASFEKDYLSGVYGGIPFIKEFSMKDGE